MNVGELFATLSLNDQPFRAALDAAENSLRSFRSSLASAAEAAAGLVKGAAIGGVVAVGGALTGAAAAGLSFNNALEQTTAQLQAMTKDAAQTEAILQMIKQRAAETPFAFTEMANAAASLLPAAKASGAQLEDLLAVAEVLAASNPAQGLEGAAFALREALSGDFVSVVERFNLPRSEINRLKEEGVPALEAIRQTLAGMGLDASVVSAQANTLQGRWGRVTDTLQQLAGVVTQPIFDAASAALGRFADLLDRNLPALQQFAETIAGRLRDGLTAVQPVLGTIAATAQNAFGAIGPLVTDATAKLAEFAPVIETAKTVLNDLWVSVQPALNELAALFGTVKDRVTGLFGAVGEKAPAVKGLLANLAGVAVASFRQTAQTIASVIGIIRSVFDAFAPLVEAIVSVIVDFLKENGAEIFAFFLTVREKIGSIIVTLFEITTAILIPIFTFLADFIRDNQETIEEIFSRVWGAIEGIVSGALSVVEGLLKSVLALLKGDTDTALAELENAFNAAFEGIKKAFSSLFDWAAPFVEEQIKNLTETIIGFFDNAVKMITGLPEKVKNAVSDFGGSVFEGVSSAFQLPQLPQLPFFGQPNQNRTVNVTVNAQYPSTNRSLFDDIALATRIIR